MYIQSILFCISFIDKNELVEYSKKHIKRSGTSYGGWMYLSDIITNNSIIYSFGIGKDLSWDINLIREKNCHIFGFDNTPMSNKWFSQVQQHQPELKRFFHKQPYLLANYDGVMTVNLPVNHGISFVNTKNSKLKFKSKPYTLQCRTLKTLMKMLNHERIDILKIDVEGAEFDIFNELVKEYSNDMTSLIPACQLLIEFHVRFFDKPNLRISTIKNLNILGFEEIYSDNLENIMLMNPKFC